MIIPTTEEGLSLGSPRVISAIQIVVIRGAGTAEDRCREVTQYWTLDGKFLAEYDPCTDTGR